MATTYSIEKFLQTIPGSYDKLKDVISKIEYYGDWKKIYEVDVIIKHILTALLIPRRTYIFNPNYGSAIYKYLFEPSDIITYEAISNEIDTVISNISIKPGTKVNHDVLFFRNKKGFRINITVEHKSAKRSLDVDIDESILTIIV